uniref:GPI ethanolamine phosphate transferase 3 n=1 Tax=Acrobeloides nanus TaxID=290746 RepID=A0A914D243_9BILA
MFFAKLLLLTISYLLSLLIFQRGLLLKRQVLRQQSNCTDVHANPACWIQHRYNRSIWLVIDALRYDFVAPLSYNATSSHFLGQMPLTSRLIVEQPEHTRLFHFTADAPTTTLQRLKALTTGTLPTFIEAGENFGGTEILEDNLVNQLVNQGKNVTFIGDDTWLSLLPKKFHRFFHAPSFDIKDLHTVDNLVLGKIYDEISRDDWSVLIAHTLGVDHCGHRYGLENFEMTAKLRQMDELVYNLTNLIDDDTILFVMGDHGMTKSGDHGGDSALEMDAALFVFSNKLPDYSNINFDFTDTVNQIDFVPTLSLLLDIPIPFSNLGKLIPSLFSPNQLTQAMRINCMQIIRFVQTYINQEPSFKVYT